LKQILKDIFKILNAAEKLKLWKLALADVFISVLDIAFLIALLFLINYYTVPAHGSLPKSISYPIFDHYPFLLFGFFTILFTLKNLIGFYITREQFQFVYGVASRISRDGLLQYLNGPYGDYIHVDSSVMNRRINQQPIEFCHYVLNGVQQIFSQIVLVFITLFAIILFNPLLFPLLLIILAPPVILVSFIMKRRLHNSRQMGQKTSERSIQYLQEALSGYIESNIYLKNEFFTNRYHRFQKQLNHYLSERLIIQAMPPRFIEIFAVFGLFVLILVNFFAFHNSSVQLFTVGALMVAAYKIIPGIVKITNAVGQVRTYSYTTAGLGREEITKPDKHAEVQAVSSVVFENIHFSFKDRLILNGFSLNMSRGDMIGMTGISGRGKTTFVNLLLGFLQPDSGKIYINGVESCTESGKGIWSRTSYIKQQHFFLHATMLENITLQEDRADMKKVKDILEITGISEFLMSLPDGLNTIITENGKNFSGGQRQRLIFARALYHDFDLLVMDEPFNELDEESEIEMLRVLQNISGDGKIVLLITHRQASLLYCNKKIILDDRD
jgi:ABC-type multidrug transport system fused ATPase/permease subunit